MSYGNTVGSRGSKPITWSKEIRNLQRRLTLSPFQRDVLIETILGDGCLTKNAYGKNYRLQIEQKETHKDYVEWLYQVFQNFCLSGPKYRVETNSFRFRTISHPEFTRFRKIFYRKERKIIPKEINELLKNSISLAVWFMDDGGMDTHKKTITFSTHGFSKVENRRLIECVRKNFRLEINLEWDGKGFRLYLPIKNIRNLLKIISPSVLPSMKYKLPLTP